MRAMLAVFRNRNIAILLSGRVVSIAGDWLYSIALSIAIYKYSHGASLFIGLFFLTRLMPSFLLGPFTGALADRLGYRKAMIVADLGRLVVVLLLALLLRPATWAAIYPAAFLVAMLAGIFNPASIGLIPSVVNSREERLAANAAMIQATSIALIGGSIIGGVVAGLGYITQLLIADAATFGFSALTLQLIQPRPAPAPAPVSEESAEGEEPEEEEGKGFIGGFRLLTKRPVLVFAASIMALPELASGAVMVWIVPYAESNLHLGPPGVGYFYAALGIGVAAGGVVAAVVGSNVRLDYLMAGSIAVGGVGLALFGIIPLAVTALLFLAIVGLSETVEYAAYETLLQQSVPETMIGRAAGTMDSFLFNMVIVGNLVSGFMAAWLGLPLSIGGLGLLTVLVTGAAWWRLRRETEGQPDAAALARITPFAAVPADVREWAVRRMLREQFPAGAVVIRQGDEGDKFYTIAKGKAQVEVASDGHVMERELDPGDFFGEIALLQHVPRTATVRAETPLTLWTLSREDFEDLQARAAEFKESLMETANARMEDSTNFKMALATRG